MQQRSGTVRELYGNVDVYRDNTLLLVIRVRQRAPLCHHPITLVHFQISRDMPLAFYIRLPSQASIL